MPFLRILVWELNGTTAVTNFGFTVKLVTLSWVSYSLVSKKKLSGAWWGGYRVLLHFHNLLLHSCAYHHDVVPQARISLTHSRHFSLSFIASGRSSGLHPVSSHSCCMYVRAGCPALEWPYVGVHRSTSLMSSFLFLQQCPACLVRLTWIVFEMGGRWPYSWCLVGCCHQDLFNAVYMVWFKIRKIKSSIISHHTFYPFKYANINVLLYVRIPSFFS